MVGRGHEPPSIIDDLLDLQRFPAKPQYTFAPEHPLLLYDSGFRDLNFVRKATSTSGTVHVLQKRLEHLDVERGMLLAALRYLRCAKVLQCALCD